MRQTFDKIIGKAWAPCTPSASYGPVRNALTKKPLVKLFCLLIEKTFLDLKYTV